MSPPPHTPHSSAPSKGSGSRRGPWRPCCRAPGARTLTRRRRSGWWTRRRPCGCRSGSGHVMCVYVCVETFAPALAPMMLKSNHTRTNHNTHPPSTLGRPPARPALGRVAHNLPVPLQRVRPLAPRGLPGAGSDPRDAAAGVHGVRPRQGVLRPERRGRGGGGVRERRRGGGGGGGE